MNTDTDTITVSLLDAARAEYLALFDSLAEAVEFEGATLDAVNGLPVALDPDAETDAHLQDVVARIIEGDQDAADAAYYGWLTSQFEEEQLQACINGDDRH